MFCSVIFMFILFFHNRIPSVQVLKLFHIYYTCSQVRQDAHRQLMDITALLLELVTTLIILVTKPFWLFKRSCIFGVKTIFIVINTWIELMTAAICLHVNLFWRLAFWTVAFISLPGRLLNALRRERLVSQLQVL